MRGDGGPVQMQDDALYVVQERPKNRFLSQLEISGPQKRQHKKLMTVRLFGSTVPYKARVSAPLEGVWPPFGRHVNEGGLDE
jgi:hypothetical protein